MSDIKASKLKPFSSKIDEKTLENLEEFALKHSLKKSRIINKAILDFIKKYNKKKIKVIK